MISMAISIKLYDTPDKAPTYTGAHVPVKINGCSIVGKGTISGNPTVDLQLVDAAGNKFLIMTTGAIMESIAAAVGGMRKRGSN